MLLLNVRKDNTGLGGGGNASEKNFFNFSHWNNRKNSIWRDKVKNKYAKKSENTLDTIKFWKEY